MLAENDTSLTALTQHAFPCRELAEIDREDCKAEDHGWMNREEAAAGDLVMYELGLTLPFAR